ncbi:MAG: hypothetical protein LIO93_08490 [Bacteroidales bacterium]|nr:hypothetical protein [Bacteroidales bacterium]
MNIEVLNRQTFFDLAIQETGEIENAFLIAGEKSVTEIPLPGSLVEVPEQTDDDPKVKTYFSTRELKPACGFDPEAISTQQGISFWYVNFDFIVTSNT